MVRKAVLIFFLLASVAKPLLALESIQLDKASALPVEFRLVTSCGQWHAGGKQGYYRLVVADVYGGAGSELYVQWIEQATQETPPAVVKTLAFPELNDDHRQYDFRTVECARKGGAPYVRATATYEHDETDKTHEIWIRLVDIGRYQLSETVRPAGATRPHRSPAPTSAAR